MVSDLRIRNWELAPFFVRVAGACLVPVGSPFLRFASGDNPSSLASIRGISEIRGRVVSSYRPFNAFRVFRGQTVSSCWRVHLTSRPDL